MLTPFIVTQTSQNETTTYTYYSQSLEESFSFSPLTANIQWSIQLNATSLEGFNLSYILSLPNGSPLPSVPFFPNRTYNYIMTYYIPLEGDLYALLAVPQLASGSVPVGHSFQGSTLLLQFPPFNSSLYYDPSIGLAKLLGGGGGGSSSDDEPLIIGVVVGGSVALLLVFGVILLALIIAKINCKSNRESSINYGTQLDKNQL